MATLAALPLETVEVTPLHPERFAEVLPPDAVAAFQHSIARGNELLGSRTVWNVNSTAFGGGVDGSHGGGSYTSRFVGIGASIPERRVSTAELMASTDHETQIDLERLTGVRERGVVG